jgi:hypothetical protein
LDITRIAFGPEGSAVPADATHPFPVTAISGAGTQAGALTDRSGTITVGGTAQTLAAANSVRKYLLIQNNSTGALWVNFGAAAVQGQPSIQLAANGGSLVMEAGFVSNQSVSIIGATTGQAYSAKEG